MANNRLFLVCRECPDDTFLLAKYYPKLTTGWFVKPHNNPDNPELREPLDIPLEDWMQKHSHASTGERPYAMYDGGRFTVTYEENEQK